MDMILTMEDRQEAIETVLRWTRARLESMPDYELVAVVQAVSMQGSRVSDTGYPGRLPG
jgi:hypothetical protein